MLGSTRIPVLGRTPGAWKNPGMDLQSFGRTPRDADRLYRRQVDRAWEALVDGRLESLDSGPRELVRESWLRCLAMGVEPVAQRPAHAAAGLALDALRDQNAELLNAFQNTWRVLGDILADTHSCLIIADEAGTMLDICGSPLVLSLGERDGIGPGYAWSERSGGTNAIGTAIARNAPAEVHRSEHLLSVAKRWSCSAAPVRDSVDGRLVGVVDVTSFGEQHQQHCLALAVTAAHQIEETLQSRELARAVQLLHWYQGLAATRPHQALLLLDRKGRLLVANDLARAFFAGHALTRGQAFLGTPARASLAEASTHLPPRLRAVALEPWSRSLRVWEGGLLVLEAPRQALKAPARVRVQSPDALATTLQGDSPLLREARRRALRLAQASAPILISGPRGAGKARFAEAIHAASAEAGGPFILFPSLSVEPEKMMDALFGEVSGSAGGNPGAVLQAEGGSLYVEEIAALSPAAQLGLLRLIQEGLLPVPAQGHLPPRRVAVRVLAGTAEDLSRAVTAQRFRADLHQRLKVLALELPPLSARLEDLPQLVTHFLRELEQLHGLGARRASPALIDALGGLRFAENLDDLRNVLEEMYVMSDGDWLDVEDLPRGAPAAHAEPMPAPARIDDMERAAIAAALVEEHANLSAVARRLGISRSTLYRKLGRYGLG